MPLTTAATLPQTAVDQYRRDGFVHVPAVLPPEDVLPFYNAALSAAERFADRNGNAIFSQTVNVWPHDDTLRRLTLNENLAALAAKLAGVPLRVWHDQVLIKQPRNAAATEFHQDQPYWPHAGGTHPISAWVALCDVPVERGCMTFLPGSQHLTELGVQNLGSATSLFEAAPELVWGERVTVPLKAGDCTFHHGRCGHMATPNFTDDPRVAHVVIYMDENTVFTGGPHVVTDGETLPVNEPFGASARGRALFPAV